MKTAIVAISLLLAQPALALEFDPYNEQGRLNQERADASDPHVIALHRQAMSEYWHCVTVAGMDLAESQRMLGPICNQTWESWFNTQVSAYHLK